MKYTAIINQQKFQFNFAEDLQTLHLNLPHTQNLFSQATFLQKFQQVAYNIHHQVVVIKQGENVVGQLYFQIMPFKGKELATYIPQESRCFLGKTVEALVDLALERINWKLAVLGNIFITGDNGQTWYANIDDHTKWKLINEAVEFYTKQENVDAILISEIEETQLEGSNYLVHQKYRKFEVEPDLKFFVQAEWQTFNDYLESLTSKYRVRTNKVLEKSTSLVLQNMSLQEITQNEKLIFDLYKRVVDQADFKLAEVPFNYFSKMKECLQDDFQLVGVFNKQKLIGFVCYIVNTNCLNINFVGIDYQYNRTFSMYQRMLYHCIEEGIIRHKKMVHFGRTATEIKTAIGAQPFVSYSFIKHNSKIPNIAIKPLTTYLKPEEYTKRNPFKKEVVEIM